jgi:hypothetical protein
MAVMKKYATDRLIRNMKNDAVAKILDLRVIIKNKVTFITPASNNIVIRAVSVS